MKKIIYPDFFRSTRLVKAMKLDGLKTITANWSITKSLPAILKEVTAGGLLLHHDNVSTHTSRCKSNFLNKNTSK